MALHKQDWFARPKIWTIVSSQESRLQEGAIEISSDPASERQGGCQIVRMTKKNKDNKKNESIGGKTRNSYYKRKQKTCDAVICSKPY